MAVILGKRKRRVEKTDPSASESDADDVEARALFQRAFEAKFQPLEPDSFRSEDDEPAKDDGKVSDTNDVVDWNGLSDDDSDTVEVINLHQDSAPDYERQKLEKKAFMSSKPPINPETKSVQPKPVAKADEEDSAEAANLKHDLALQRLLKESHLLTPSSYNGTADALQGKSRLKALDLRLKALGAKQAITEQVKMPLAHRKGINAKATKREVTRRKDAADSGVVLEKAKVKKAVRTEPRRERAVGNPSLGKLRGGMLKLSSRDVKMIEGPKTVAGGKGKGRRE